MTDLVPAALTDLHQKAVAASDRIDTLRAYVTLIDQSYKVLERVRRKVKTLDGEVRRLQDDHTFFRRHEAKVDALHQALRGCYAHPNKVLRTLEDMVAAYPTEYVFEVCRLGVWRLGTPSGWGFLWMTSPERQAAAATYEAEVLPAIGQVLPDHRDFVALRKSDIVEQFEQASKLASSQRQALAALEGAMPKWTEEMRGAAHALKQGEVDRLTQEEREVRRQLLAPRETDLDEVDEAV
ncbi:MAG: hypothetical protein NXI19_08645 [Alphaproteobacteria bacterium]|nr:hypothetical protein [Alphaproteobacteria bacterium]